MILSLLEALLEMMLQFPECKFKIISDYHFSMEKMDFYLRKYKLQLGLELPLLDNAVFK